MMRNVSFIQAGCCCEWWVSFADVFLDNPCRWLLGPAVIDVILAFLLTGKATAFGTETNRTGCLAVTVICTVINEEAC